MLNEHKKLSRKTYHQRKNNGGSVDISTIVSIVSFSLYVSMLCSFWFAHWRYSLISQNEHKQLNPRVGSHDNHISTLFDVAGAGADLVFLNLSCRCMRYAPRHFPHFLCNCCRALKRNALFISCLT